MSRLKTVSQSLLLPLTQQFSLPQSLIYFVTSRCNAACDFCLYYDQLNNTDNNHVELTAEEVAKVAAAYGRLHYLGLSGGEPFIRKDLAAICQAFVDHCQVQVIDIPSNFYYGDRMMEFAEFFLSANPNVTLDLQFSLDNLGEKHDESRKVKGLFDKAIQNFRSLFELKKKFPNLRMKVNLVFLPGNKDSLRDILRELRTILSFDRIQITYPHYLLEREKTNREALLDDLKLFCEIAAEADYLGNDAYRHDLYSLGLRSVKNIYRTMLQQAASDKLNTGAYCEAGKNIVVMTEAGDIFPCEILWDQKIGNVREHQYNIRQILEAHIYKKFREQYLGRGKCNCTWSCAMNTEVLVNYKYFPKLALTAFSLLLKQSR